MEYRYVLDDKHIEKKYLENLGKRIKEIRVAKGLRQTEIAYRCHFDKSSLNTIEAGKRNVTILNLRKIAMALNVEISEFFTQENN